jgi:hypothetical protein
MNNTSSNKIMSMIHRKRDRCIETECKTFLMVDMKDASVEEIN